VVELRLSIEGSSVERIILDYAISLVFSGGWELRVETSCYMSQSYGAEVMIDSSSVTSGAAVDIFNVLHRKINIAEIDESSGELVVEFEAEMKLRIPPDGLYEARGLTARNGDRILALPGGGVASWGFAEFT